MLVGAFIGELIGLLIGIDANVGGVGISMLLLILVAAKGQASGRIRPISATGITFWSGIYIPVVGATVLAGVLAVVVSCALVPLLSRIGGEPPPPLEPVGGQPPLPKDASVEQGG